MEPNEFYAYPGTYFMCGSCGSSMSPVYPQTGSWRYKLYCGNSNCRKHLIIFELGEEARVPIFDTGERAPDPVVLQQQLQARAGTAGTTGIGIGATVPTRETNFRNITAGTEGA